MVIRRANASWPQPAPVPRVPTEMVIVDRVRRMGDSTVAVVEGTTFDGVPVRCLLGTEVTLQLGRQVLLGQHPVVAVPGFAIIAAEEASA